MLYVLFILGITLKHGCAIIFACVHVFESSTPWTSPFHTFDSFNYQGESLLILTLKETNELLPICILYLGSTFPMTQDSICRSDRTSVPTNVTVKVMAKQGEIMHRFQICVMCT